jgi:hypothetical protein
MSPSLRISTSSRWLRWPGEQVGRRCQTSGGAVKDQVELCKASAGADPESICRSRTVLVVRASPKTPRFLPVRGRHGSALFRAFVRVEGDPPRPRRRERPAGGSPTVFGPRHRKRVPMAGKGSAATGEGAGRGWNRTTSGKARGVTAPGYLRRGALGDAGRSLERQDASGEGHQAWRSDLAKAMWSQRPVRGSRERGRTAEDGRRP